MKNAAKKPEAPLLRETVEMAEKASYEMFREMQDAAFKQGGMIAVVGAGTAAMQVVDAVMESCREEKMDTRMTRSIVAGYLLTDFLPPVIKHLGEMPPEPI